MNTKNEKEEIKKICNKKKYKKDDRSQIVFSLIYTTETRNIRFSGSSTYCYVFV